MERSTLAAGDNDQGSNSKSVGSFVKIDSICIDLGITTEKKKEAGNCHHFSIRGYVAEMRTKDGSISLPYASDGDNSKSDEQLPPLHVARFRWWRCQKCLQEISGAGTSKEIGEVSKCCKTGAISNSACSHIPFHGNVAVVSSDMQEDLPMNDSEGRKADEKTTANLNVDENCLLSSSDKNEKELDIVQKAFSGHENAQRKVVENAPSLCGEENHSSPSNDKEERNAEVGHKAVIGHENVPKDDAIRESTKTGCELARNVQCAIQQRLTDHRESEAGSLVDISEPTSGIHDMDSFPASGYLEGKGNSSAVISLEERSDFADVVQGNELAVDKIREESLMIVEVGNAVEGQSIKLPFLQIESHDNASSRSDMILAGDSHNDPQNDNSSGLPRRRTRKVRLLTDLLSGKGNTEKNHKRKESYSCRLPSVSVPPGKLDLHESVWSVGKHPHMKRKMPHDQDWKPIDRNCSSNGKRSRSFKGDADARIRGIEISDWGSERDLNPVGSDNNDENQWSKHGTIKNSMLDKGKKKVTQVGDGYYTSMSWREIVPKMKHGEMTNKMNHISFGNADKHSAAADITLKPKHEAFTGKGIKPYFRSSIPTQQTERHSCLSKTKIDMPQVEDRRALLRPHINHFFGEGSMKKNDLEKVGGSEVGKLHSETEECAKLGLELSLSSYIDAQRNGKSNGAEVEGKNIPLLSTRNVILSQDARRKDDFYSGESSLMHKSTVDLASKEGLLCNFNERIAQRAMILHEQKNYPPQISNEKFSLDFFDQRSTRKDSGVQGCPEVIRVHSDQRTQKVFGNGTSDDVPMDIVELMAKNQFERSLSNLNRSGVMPLLQKEYTSARKPPSSSATIGMHRTGKHVAPTIKIPASFSHQERNRFNMGQQAEVPPFAMFDAPSQSQQKIRSVVQFSDSGTPGNRSSKNQEWNECKMAQSFSPTNVPVLEAYNLYHNGLRGNESAGNIWSPATHKRMPFGHNIPLNCTAQAGNREMCTPSRNLDKGKGIATLDLNLDAASLEEQNQSLDFESLKRTEYTQMGSLDSSYSNETIPAMQLLSLMDAGVQSSTPFSINGKKFLEKPFSPAPSNNHSGLSWDGKQNSFKKALSPYSGLRRGVIKPVESSRLLPQKSCECSPGIPVDGFAALFRNGGNGKKAAGMTGQVFPRPQEQRGTLGSTGSLVYPFQWHAIEGSSKFMDSGAHFMQGAVRPAKGQTETGVCTINRNPADFSTPEPGNVFMIGGEDLKPGKKNSFWGKSVLANSDGRKRQKVAKTMPTKERVLHRKS